MKSTPLRPNPNICPTTENEWAEFFLHIQPRLEQQQQPFGVGIVILFILFVVFI